MSIESITSEAGKITPTTSIDSTFQFCNAEITNFAVADKTNARAGEIQAAAQHIMGSISSIATHGAGMAATAAAATALLAGGVSPVIAGTAALAGVATAFLNNKDKGNGRG
jgi:hypothetical protein